MSVPYPLLFYHCYKGRDSFFGTYSCVLQDGGLFIAQAVHNGIEFIIHKDGEQRVIPLPFSYVSCIGIDGFTIEGKEILILLLKSENKSISKGKACLLEAIMFDSRSDISQERFYTDVTRTGVSFVPSYMKTFHVENSTDVNRFVFLGNVDGTTTVFDMIINQEGKTLRLSRSHLFTEFFPKAQSYLISMDFLEIDENRRLWAFGYANGLVCVYSISYTRFEFKSKLKTKVIEYDPIDDIPIKYDKDTQKLVIATHLSSPVHCVKMIKSLQSSDDNDFTVDFVATSYDEKLVYFPNILKEFMKKPVECCNTRLISCVNCLTLKEDWMILGDLANCVHVFKKRKDKPGYDCENIIGVNDCVYYVALLNGVLMITTKQGIYLFKMSE